MSQDKLSADEKMRKDIVSLSMIIDKILSETRVLSEKIKTAESFQVGVEDSTRTKYMRGIWP